MPGSRQRRADRRWRLGCGGQPKGLMPATTCTLTPCHTTGSLTGSMPAVVANAVNGAIGLLPLLALLALLVPREAQKGTVTNGPSQHQPHPCPASIFPTQSAPGGPISTPHHRGLINTPLP